MTREEAIKILSILKISYPNFYKDIDETETLQTVELYQEMFADCDIKLVAVAVKELINSFKYPPTIADIKNKMYELCNKNDDKSPSELWDKLLKAIRNGSYGYLEEFEKLPKEVKDFVREPRQLQELAQMDSNTVNSVVKGQFLKQIEIIKQRRKEESLMLLETKKVIGSDNNENIQLLET